MYVAIRELKNHLSRYLKRVSEGEEIVVTAHGKPVARINGVPPDQTTETALGSVAWIRQASTTDGTKLTSFKPVKPRQGAPLSDLILEDRE